MFSRLGDYTAIANRVALGSVTLEGHTYSVDDLEAAHKAITNDIAKTIRWGYVEATDDAEEKVGEPENLIVSVEHHSNFVHALFEKRQAGLREPRRPIHFFTTNYDTLLEDALADRKSVVSGKSVSVRVDLGGRRIIKKKKKK